MSALVRIADLTQTSRDVRDVPQTDILLYLAIDRAPHPKTRRSLAVETRSGPILPSLASDVEARFGVRTSLRKSHRP